STSLYRAFHAHNGLEARISASMQALAAGSLSLREAGKQVREAFLTSEWPADARRQIEAAYSALAAAIGSPELAVAVRSSATAEDLPEASFAGQQESYLNVRGLTALLDACRRCYASLFTDRAITYRQVHGFEHLAVALSIGVQRMVRADLACAGVIFSLDTETGLDRVATITAAWGLGENVVQGAVNPDEYLVFKPLLGDPALLPILDRRLGSKERRMVYGEAGGPAIRNLDTSPEERARFTLSDAEVLQLA